MKIRMLKECAGPKVNLHAGKEYDVPKAEAYALIEAGAARQVAADGKPAPAANDKDREDAGTAAVEQPETTSRRRGRPKGRAA